MTSSTSVLVAGIPRSGTTWTGQVLAHAHGSALSHEPDNEKQHLEALRAKRRLGRFPVLAPGDSAAGYENLWRRAFSGAPELGSRRNALGERLWRRSTQGQREAAVSGHVTPGLRAALTLARHRAPAAGKGRDVVVKSVHAPLALEWLADRFPSVRVVVVVRHPANVLSSVRELQLPDQDRALDRHPAVRDGLLPAWGVPPPGPGELERAAWQVCLLTTVLLEASARHPEWLVAEHDDLCRRPAEQFAGLSASLGLTWNGRADEFLSASNAAGEGFAVRRRAEAQPGRWRSRLTGAEVDVLARTMRTFPLLERWSDDLASPTAPTGHG
jgi:hypothetical protein